MRSAAKRVPRGPALPSILPYLRQSLCQQLVLLDPQPSVVSISRTTPSIHHGSTSQGSVQTRSGGSNCETEVGNRRSPTITWIAYTTTLLTDFFLEQNLLHQGQAEPDPGDLGEISVSDPIHDYSVS